MSVATVLVVDDQPIVLNTLVAILTRAGFEVIPAHSARQALRVCRDRLSPIAVALVDVVMPEISGLEVQALLRTEFPALPVLLMSGYPLDGIALRAENGADFLPKPFTPRTLVDRIWAVIGENPPRTT